MEKTQKEKNVDLKLCDIDLERQTMNKEEDRHTGLCTIVKTVVYSQNYHFSQVKRVLSFYKMFAVIFFSPYSGIP